MEHKKDYPAPGQTCPSKQGPAQDHCHKDEKVCHGKDAHCELKSAKPEDKPVVFFVLGGPGSGKGTLCNTLVSQHHFVHLSAGDLLREEINNKESKDGVLINEYIANGKIVPVDITIGLIEKAMKAKGWEKARFLIDGFPRNPDNEEGWQRVIGDKANVRGIIYIKCSEDIMTKRIKKRAETSGRIDDNDETIKKRLKGYVVETFPIIEKKQQDGSMKVFELNGEDTPNVVCESCLKLIAPYL